MSQKLPGWKYPRNWKKVSKTLRRVVGRCEECGQESNDLSVHHVGAPYQTGLPGDPRDKHDLRRENLKVVCFACHDQIDHITQMKKKRKKRDAKRQARREAHRALGIGTGLVVLA